jgi:mercuric ion transport protein
MKKPAPETAAIFAGTVSAIGASACCVLPLILVSVGVGGAWVAQLRALERLFPVFAGIAVAAFAFAFYRVYVRPAPCGPYTACPAPQTRRRRQIIFWATLGLAAGLMGLPYVHG